MERTSVTKTTRAMKEKERRVGNGAWGWWGVRQHEWEVVVCQSPQEEEEAEREVRACVCVCVCHRKREVGGLGGVGPGPPFERCVSLSHFFPSYAEEKQQRLEREAS